jgi:hypothetical protein
MPRPGLRWGGARGRTDKVIEQRVLDQRGRLLLAALGFAGLPHPSYDCALWALGPGWTPGPVSAGSRSAWHTRASTFQLTRYDERGWRATFYPTVMEHSPTSATGTGWEPTPWHATPAGGVGSSSPVPSAFLSAVPPAGTPRRPR